MVLENRIPISILTADSDMVNLTSDLFEHLSKLSHMPAVRRTLDTLQQIPLKVYFSKGVNDVNLALNTARVISNVEGYNNTPSSILK